MTVRELIERLSVLDPGLDVYGEDEQGEAEIVAVTLLDKVEVANSGQLQFLVDPENVRYYEGVEGAMFTDKKIVQLSIYE